MKFILNYCFSMYRTRFPGEQNIRHFFVPFMLLWQYTVINNNYIFKIVFDFYINFSFIMLT